VRTQENTPRRVVFFLSPNDKCCELQQSFYPVIACSKFGSTYPVTANDNEGDILYAYTLSPIYALAFVSLHLITPPTHLLV